MQKEVTVTVIINSIQSRHTYTSLVNMHTHVLFHFSCPPEIEFLDVENCAYSNSSSAVEFPDCCPVLECIDREPVNTTVQPDGT